MPGFLVSLAMRHCIPCNNASVSFATFATTHLFSLLNLTHLAEEAEEAEGPQDAELLDPRVAAARGARVLRAGRILVDSGQ